MDDKKLILDLKEAFNAKDITELAKKINIPYPTLMKWNNKNLIPEQGSAKQYLEQLLINKKQEAELESYKQLDAIIEKIQSFKK